MQIADNHVVSIHYNVSSQEGQEIDSSLGQAPLEFIQGSNYMISGLEEALYGKSAGNEFSVTIEPEKAYGARHEHLIQKVPLSMFDGIDVDVGMSFRATTDHGEQSVLIIDKDEDSVTVDGNHPLAGHTLVFDVKVENVREATEHELAHGLHCNHDH